MRALCLSLVILACSSLTHGAAARQSSPPVVDAQPVDVDAAVKAVTLYPGRAAVTRSASVALQPGAYDLHFSGLPESVQTDTLQARAVAAGLRVLSVEYVQQNVADAAAGPELALLDKQIGDLAAALRELTDQRDLIKTQEDFLNALTIRTTGDAAKEAGTDHLDLDAVRKQMEFITKERQRLQGERRTLDDKLPKAEKELAAAKANRDAAAARSSASRSAVVTVVAPEPYNGEITLTYLVANATWEAAYNIRAASDLSTAQIEYDALLTQRSGEDWNDVRLTLSTAQPTLAANPPLVQPFYMDIARPHAPELAAEVSRSGRMDVEAAARAPEEDRRLQKAALETLAADAQIGGGGPSVTFELPRAVTVKTNLDRQQRTRITTIETTAQFVHVATPLLSERVYLRGDLSNTSAYQLLAGRAAIFLGQDYVGPTTMAAVSPGGEFQMHFGIDQAVKVKRQMLSKTTENTGLLSGGRRTSYEYRIDVDNGTGHDITLELWDRIPVSRTEEIQVQLVNPQPRPATDQYYVTEQQPQGLLKWWLTIPASARDRNAASISWGLRIDRAKDVQMTPLPE